MIFYQLLHKISISLSDVYGFVVGGAAGSASADVVALDQGK